MRTRIDIASFGAAPWTPSSISRSRGERFSTKRPEQAPALHTAVCRGRARSTQDYNSPMHRTPFVLACIMALGVGVGGQRSGAPADITVLKPARVFDGDAMHEGWAVRVRGDRIEAVGPDAATAG